MSSEDLDEMSFTNLRGQIEQSDNVFLKMPHIFKPLQTVLTHSTSDEKHFLGHKTEHDLFTNYFTTQYMHAMILNAIILAVCVGSTAGNLKACLQISIAATIIFALGLQDNIMDSLTNGSVAWNVVELVYSFVFAILSVICVWLSFGFANRHLGGTSAGYIAAGLFSIVHAGLYAVPCAVIYDSIQTNGIRPDRGFDVQPAHPFHETPYQDL
ncbi:hypothetical protein ANCCEY_06873 [Ancylostoma ceylanicum]|uniref:MARVEL domain-containing protein n=1 Tax=Ancylostoma ceylanicum TaxID=53326 RepID=A0A0D6LS65_9BILA|nr:hypothetical protein ANCCEY_06873 [Ancylostoma ceylanicum]